MLAKAFNLPIVPGRLAALSRQHRHLLEIITSLFCELVFSIVHRGLPRAYIGQTADLPSVRGKLDVHRQFSVLAASPQKLARPGAAGDVAGGHRLAHAAAHLAALGGGVKCL